MKRGDYSGLCRLTMTRKRNDCEVSSCDAEEKNCERTDDEEKASCSSRMLRAWSELRESFEKAQGFSLKDLTSFERFVRLMYRPTDPASLGMARALFGKFLFLVVVCCVVKKVCTFYNNLVCTNVHNLFIR